MMIELAPIVWECEIPSLRGLEPFSPAYRAELQRLRREEDQKRRKEKADAIRRNAKRLYDGALYHADEVEAGRDD